MGPAEGHLVFISTLIEPLESLTSKFGILNSILNLLSFLPALLPFCPPALFCATPLVYLTIEPLMVDSLLNDSLHSEKFSNDQWLAPKELHHTNFVNQNLLIKQLMV